MLKEDLKVINKRKICTCEMWKKYGTSQNGDGVYIWNECNVCGKKVINENNT